MHYVIQKNLWREHNFDKVLDMLKNLDLTYDVVRYVPFVNEIEDASHIERKDIWVFGSNNMAAAAFKYGWVPGSMYNDNHDFRIYGEKYGEHMLNHGCHIMAIDDPLPERFDYFFAKPTNDTKSFSGQLYERNTWYKWVSESIANDTIKILTEETVVLISPLKQIQQEVRCWVVDGKVITISAYKLGVRVVYKNYDDERMFFDFAQRMVDIYQPARAFVIDVCLADDELKIVEVNCINCSGFYEANMEKLILALEKAFDRKENTVSSN